MLATSPQNRSGFSVITCGPGAMPYMVSAPSMSAITPLAGRPSVSMGMNLHCASALLADSGPQRPRWRLCRSARGPSLASSRPCRTRTTRSTGRCRAARRRTRRSRCRAGSGRGGLEVCAGRRDRFLTCAANSRRSSGPPRLFRISTMANTPRGERREVDAVLRFGRAEGEALRAGIHIGADEAEHQSEDHHAPAITTSGLRQHRRGDQPASSARNIPAALKFSARHPIAAFRSRADHDGGRRSRRRTSRWRQSPALRRRGPDAPAGSHRWS